MIIRDIFYIWSIDIQRWWSFDQLFSYNSLSKKDKLFSWLQSGTKMIWSIPMYHLHKWWFSAGQTPMAHRQNSFFNGEHDYVYIYISIHIHITAINSGFDSKCSDTPTMRMQSRHRQSWRWTSQSFPRHADLWLSKRDALWAMTPKVPQIWHIHHLYLISKWENPWISIAMLVYWKSIYMSMVISSIFAWIGQSVSSWQ